MLCKKIGNIIFAYLPSGQKNKSDKVGVPNIYEYHDSCTVADSSACIGKNNNIPKECCNEKKI